MHYETLGADGSPAAFDYRYAEVADGAGELQFTLRADIDRRTGALEAAAIDSRWLASGAGRADAQYSGGDLGALQVSALECWDTAFRRVHYADSSGWQPAEGDPAACALPAAGQ
jgi:hypothetical protein